MTTTLPPGFPLRMSETDKHKVLWYYHRYVEEYYPQYQFGHFMLAAYASVPALLTPDLLYKIWQNFHAYRWGNQNNSIHRIAVSDLLLSPLCHEVGFELYEMHSDIRKSFWEWLKIESGKNLWKNRGLRPPDDVASFLSEYHARPNPGIQRWGDGYFQVQDYAVHFSKGEYDKLQFLFSMHLQEALKHKRETEVMRILDIWSQNGQILSNAQEEDNKSSLFQQNARSADALKALMQENPSGFLEKYGKDPGLLNNLAAGGIKIEVPDELMDSIENARAASIYALIVGVDKYLGEIPALRGCVSDAEDMADFLSRQRSVKRPVILHKLLANAAGLEAFRSAFSNLVGNAQNGDICLFFFAGHVEQNDIPDSGGRRFLLFDSLENEQRKDISQSELEEILYPVLLEKSVHCVFVLDTHEVREEALKARLNALPLRKNAASLKGSLVILNAASIGETALETINESGNYSGLFTSNSLAILKERGISWNYRALTEMVRARINQSKEKHQQTPFIEAFPAQAANYLIFSDQIVQRGRVIPAELVVREGPGTEFPVVKQLVGGTEVCILSTSSDWYEIGKKEWVATNFIELIPDFPAQNQDAIEDYKPNELLIHTLFEALGPYNSEIQKQVERAERQDTVLAFAKKRMMLLNALPAPIAESLRKLMVPIEQENEGYDKPNSARLRQTRVAYRQSMQLLVFIVLAEIQKQLAYDKTQTLSPPSRALINAFLTQSRTDSESSNISQQLLALLGVAQEINVPFFFSEMYQLASQLSGPLQENLKTLEAIKQNEMSFDAVALLALCKNSELALAQLISAIAYISKYRLISVHDVKVNVNANQNEYIHSSVIMHDLLGGFDLSELRLDHPLPNQSVLLVNEDTWESINLMPFVVDENAFIDKTGISKLYYFQSYIQTADVYSYQYVNKPDDPNLEVRNENSLPFVYQKIMDFKALINREEGQQKPTITPPPVQEEKPNTRPFIQSLELIKQLIAEDEIGKAIETLRELDKTVETGFSSEIIQTSAQFKQNERMYQQGLIPYPDYAQQGAKIRSTLLQILDQISKTSVSATQNLEKIIGNKPNLFKVNWLEKALNASKSVCRVVLKEGEVGTGFLAKDGMLFTVNHLIGSLDAAHDATVEFNFETDSEGQSKSRVVYSLDPDQYFLTNDISTLDFTIVKIRDNPEQPLSQWGFVEFEPQTIPSPGDTVTIIQHPLGADKQIALNANEVLGQLEHYLYYNTETEPGSSGAPVFNEDWKVVALHHAAKHESEGGFVVNANGDRRSAGQGVLIRDILLAKAGFDARPGNAAAPESSAQTPLQPTPEAPVSRQANGIPKFVVLYDSADEDKFSLLNKHLSALRLTKKIELYGVHHHVLAGEDVIMRAKEELEKADQILLLLSVNIFNNEDWFSLALEAIQNGKSLTPVFLNRIDIEGTGLEKLPSFPTAQPTIADFPNPDAAYLDVVEGIKGLIR